MSSLCEPLVGTLLKSLEKKDYSWFFHFGEGITVGTESEWRFIADGHILVTSSDHGHQFGLPSPVDAIAEVISRTAAQIVRAASIGEATGDLHIDFAAGLQLQFLQMSSGYESWRLSGPGLSVICGGGGRLA
jgi:uncharacterized protein DUF6188